MKINHQMYQFKCTNIAELINKTIIMILISLNIVSFNEINILNEKIKMKTARLSSHLQLQT